MLGLPRNCTDQEIKPRYKQLAQIFHPDKGGSQLKFIEIRTAYEILIDPTKRANFNDYGEVKSTKNERDAIEELKRLFEDAMNEYDPTRDDILHIVKTKTNNLKDLCCHELTTIHKKIEHWEKILVNIETNQPFNIFHESANDIIVNLKEGVDHYTNRIEVTNKMLEIITSYRFTFGKMIKST